MLNCIYQDNLPKNIPNYIDIEYFEGDLYATCSFDEKKIKLKFNHAKSFRVSQEGLLLKIQAELSLSHDAFIYNDENLALYLWLNDQSYNFLDEMALKKLMLISAEEIIEIIYGGELEFLS